MHHSAPNQNLLTRIIPQAGLFRCLTIFLLLAPVGQAAPPDLTAGGVPGDNMTINLGPTGMRGWVYHVSYKTADSRQILVHSVSAGSPAAGVFAANDVILGAVGNGLEPAHFSYDARVALADAINDAEANNPATLKLLRWRAGVTTTVSINLRTMGAYSATAPYNCPKSSKILNEGLAYIMGTNTLGQAITQETPGRYSFGAFTLLAANDPSDPDNAARMARVETAVLSMIPSEATMAQMMSDERDAGGQITWSRGHTLILLAEYYLVTGDTRVLPAIEAFAVNFAKNQSLFGTVGHIFAEKNLDGSSNGPMGGGYGTVNSAGLPCFLGLLLARQCGLTDPDTLALMDAAIERSSRFFSYYVGKGAIPYGEHEPIATLHESNGKSGLAALCFRLQPNREIEGKFNSMLATAATSEREIGHTGAFFNYLWSPLGAAAGGEEAAASFFRRARWHFDLSRRWDGGFDYDCLYGEGPHSGATWNDFRMSTATLLTYALPLRKLHLTGRGHDPARDLTNPEVIAAEAADGYVANLRGTNDLVSDLGSWSPVVQRRAAEQLATRTIDTALLSQLTAMATDPSGSSRIGATYTLGRINNSTTANSRAMTLAGLLTDPENHVRFMAAEAMRFLPQTAKMSQLNAALSAAASTSMPLFPFNEEDPLHFAHGRLAMLLFYSGTAYGPRGMIWGSGINGVDRNLLYPAIRAVSKNPVGLARSTLGQTYRNLTASDVNALADTLVDSVHFRAPADKMFSAGIRDGGLVALEKYKIADGVPVAIEYMLEDGRGSAYSSALGILKNYAGGCTTVTPDPDIIGFCKALLTGPQAAAAQAVLDAIHADPNPAPLTPFKSIQSITADSPTLTLPANQNGLHVTATDLAQGDLVYTWRKVHGVGNVTFTPNGTAAAKDTAIQFENAPGNYLFEVTVSDSRGFIEVYGTVPVTLYDSGGGLPPNSPPTANPQTVTATTASVHPITLTGADPEEYPLIYSITTQPQHGTLVGTPPNMYYTSEGGYTGDDSFIFQVMDTEGQVSSATVNITVSTASVELLAYEGFNYPVGILTGQNGGQGFSGGWVTPLSLNEQGNVWDETTNVTFDGSTLDWDGVLNNGFPTSPASGARYVGPTPTGSSSLRIYRNLATDVGTLAGEDGVLWMSAVFHMPFRSHGAGINIGFGNGYLNDRGRSFGTDTTDFIGATGWIPEATWNTRLNTVIVNDTWSSTTDDAWTTSPTPLPAGSVDFIVVLKFTFGPTTDTVEGFVFDENVTTDLTEAVFNAGRIVTTGSIDESTLDVLSICQSRFGNAIDEIRIGKTFASVVGVTGTPVDDTPPTIESFVDDRSGEAVMQNSPVTYSLTFSEAMNTSSIDTSDFGNAGTANITINSIIHPLPGITVIQVTPTSTGTLRLQIKEGAVLTDIAGNPLDTTQAIVHDTEISVTPQLIQVPALTEMTQSAAESAITSAGLTVGTISTQYHASVPAGSVISQTPTASTSVSLGASVSLVVSLGPSNGFNYAIADLPVAGEITGTMANTQTSNNVYQSLRELRTNGNPNSRISYLEHKWMFEIPTNNTLTFYLEAHRTSNNENDNFVFAYSTTGVNGTYNNMLTVTKTSDNNTSQSFVLPANTSGTIHVRVMDTDRTAGNGFQDTLYIDRMAFFTEAGLIMETVPNVVGLAQAVAEANIGAASLTVGTVTTQYSDLVAAGNVISQNPEGDQSLEQGSSVDLIVSLGSLMTTVPNVVGLTQSAAEHEITSANLVTGVVTTQSSDTVPAGQVISQNPAGGSSILPGSAVDLIVSIGDTTPPAPNPMTFAILPHATSSSSISMTATIATDANGVQYYFACVAGSGNDSGWQDSPTYIDTGLEPETEYTYTVKARDNLSTPNEGAASAPASATTNPAPSGPSATVIPIESFDPNTFFSSGITAGIDFDVDASGDPGFQAVTQAGFLSVPATTAKDYNVTHNGITFDIKTINANLGNQGRWRNNINAGDLMNDFQQWYGRFATEGNAVEAAVNLTGLTANTDYQISFFTFNVSAGQTTHSFYQGTSSADPLITTFSTGGNLGNYSTWKPGITFQINSGSDGEIAVTIQAIESLVSV